jgi:hypothetical protein
MTADEMACCKKMAGNCDMGGGNHKCCDTTANHPAPSSALAQASPIHDFSLVVIASSASIDSLTLQQTQEPFVPEVQPSSSPPASPFILKN